MNDHEIVMPVYIDFLANQPKNQKTQENFRQMLQEEFDQKLAASVERIWELPQLAVQPEGEYLDMLREARSLFIAGYFYSCVAMSGIVAERLVKDLIRTSVTVQNQGSTKTPSDDAFDQLERLDISSLINFLRKTDLLSEDATRAAQNLGELRNRYAHARGKTPEKDAVKAIEYLHKLVEGTVSLFKDFEIRNGALVMKGSGGKEEELPGECTAPAKGGR